MFAIDPRAWRRIVLPSEPLLSGSSEPLIEMAFTGSGRNGVNALRGEITACEPLTSEKISQLVARLQQRFPMQTDFSAPPESPVSYGHRLLKIEQVYEPPPEKEISKYRDALYPAWVRDCEKTRSNPTRPPRERSGRQRVNTMCPGPLIARLKFEA
jgi:hypothetical protein